MADRVLVTGASGFLAKHCIAALLARGFDVRGTLRRPATAAEVVAAVAKLIDPAGRLDFVPLDLTKDQGWNEAAAGCRYLMHVASPFPLQVPKDPNELVTPAVGGTRRALAAAARAGVERAVLTSSVAAITSGHPDSPGRIYTEADWSDAASPTISPYSLSKTLAERAAWDFIAEDRSGMRLAVINPGLILGPALDRDIGGSADVIRMFLLGKYPALPRLQFSIVDARDVAAMHVDAMLAPKAAGERFVCAGEALWLKDIGRILVEGFPAFRRKLPTRELPDFVVRLVAIFDATLRAALPDLGNARPISNRKAREQLGFAFRPAEDAIVATAQSLIDLGLVTAPGSGR